MDTLTPQNELIVNILGGNSRAGAHNCQTIDFNGQTLLIDAGGAVTDSGFSFLNLANEQVQKYRRIVLSHAHLDHIGSVDEILRLLRQPVTILGSRWTNLTVQDRLQQFRSFDLTQYAHFVEALEPSFDSATPVKSSGWYQWSESGALVTLPASSHSTPESRFVVAYIPGMGTFVWLIDMADPGTPEQEEYIADTFRKIANLGVTAVFIDSTAADQDNGRSASESLVRETLREEFASTSGTIYFTCFAPDLERIRLAVLLFEEIYPEGEILIAGKSIRDTVARGCNNKRPNGSPYINGSARYDSYLQRWQIDEIEGVKAGSVLDVIKHEKPKRLVLIAGSQGDRFDEEYNYDFSGDNHEQAIPPSALSRLVLYGLQSSDPEQVLRLKPGDKVVFSASVIPGNEERINALKTEIKRQGTIVVDEETCLVHLHGHGNIAPFLPYLNPRVVIPIHGGLDKRRAMAQNVQKYLPNVQILQVDDGQQINFSADEFGQVTAVVEDIPGMTSSRPRDILASVDRQGTLNIIVQVVSGPNFYIGYDVTTRNYDLLPEDETSVRELVNLFEATLIGEDGIIAPAKEKHFTGAIAGVLIKHFEGKVPKARPFINVAVDHISPIKFQRVFQPSLVRA